METKVGTFETEGQVVISDPCYVTKYTEWNEGQDYGARREVDEKVFEPDSLGGERLEVLPGLWNLKVETQPLNPAVHSQQYVTSVLAQHSQERVQVSNELDWAHEFDVGVDSGLMGIFDVPGAGKSWNYQDLVAAPAGPVLLHSTLPYGICVAAGLGDGTYPVYVERNDDGDIVGILIEFVDGGGK